MYQQSLKTLIGKQQNTDVSEWLKRMTSSSNFCMNLMQLIQPVGPGSIPGAAMLDGCFTLAINAIHLITLVPAHPPIRPNIGKTLL